MSIIEVFADVVCPFTHVGLRRLVERRQELGREDVVLRVRSWPLELVNGAPVKVRLIAEEVEALRAQVAPDLFRGFDAGHFPSSSLPAMALSAAAYEKSLKAGETVALALRQALFEEGRDIGDPEILGEIAAAASIDGPNSRYDDEAHADWEEGKRRGVIGSPHFFIGDQSWFCPTLDISHVDGRLSVRTNDESLQTFLAACFGE